MKKLYRYFKGRLWCRRFHKPVFYGFATASDVLVYPMSCAYCLNKWEETVPNDGEHAYIYRRN